MHAIAVVLAVLLAGGAGDDLPAQPEEPARDPKMAEVFYQAASGARSADEGLAAVRKALDHDPEHLGANVLLADLLVRQQEQAQPKDRQYQQIVELLQRVEDLVAEPDAPAKLKSQVAGVRGRLARLRPQWARWGEMRRQFADRYARLGEQVGVPSLPSTALAFARAVLLCPDDKQIARQNEGADKAQAKLPEPAERPDPAGAKLLHDQARGHLSGGRLEQASKLLTAAASLGPDNPEIWTDLGQCASREKNASLAGGCLLKAQEQLPNFAGPPAEKTRLASRIKMLLSAADSQMAAVLRIDDDLVRQGRLLATGARSAGDESAADAIESLLAEIAEPVEPPPGPVGPVGPVTSIDLSGKAVEALAIKAKVTRSRNTLSMVGDGTGNWRVTITLAKVHCGADYRMRWRLEPANGKSSVRFSGWPDPHGGYIEAYPTARTWSLAASDTTAWSKLTSYRAECPRLAFRDDRIDEVCVEKRGGTVNAWANGVRLLELRLPRDFLNKNRDKPVTVSFSAYDPKQGIKATLLSLQSAKSLAPDPTFGAACSMHSQLPMGGGNLAGKIDLANDDHAKVQGSGRLERNRDNFSVKIETDTWDCGATVVLPQFTCVGDGRVRWKVEPIGEREQRGSYDFSLWPLPDSASAYGLILWERPKLEDIVPVYVDTLMRPDCTALLPPPERGVKAFSADATYELCYEKRGPVLSASVNNEPLGELRLTAEHCRMAVNRSMEFRFKRRFSRKGGFKVTLLEATSAWKLPPASQPEGWLDLAKLPPVAGKDRGIDLSANGVTIKATPEDIPVQRRRDQLTFGTPPNSTAAKRVEVQFDTVENAGDVRIRWRIELPDKGKPGNAFFHCWPMPGMMGSTGCPARIKIVNGKQCIPDYLSYSVDYGYRFHWSQTNWKQASSEQGVHEICVEKRRRIVEVSGNSQKMMVFDLDAKLQEEIDADPAVVRLAYPPEYETVKLTLLEYKIGPGQARK